MYLLEECFVLLCVKTIVRAFQSCWNCAIGIVVLEVVRDQSMSGLGVAVV